MSGGGGGNVGGGFLGGIGGAAVGQFLGGGVGSMLGGVGGAGLGYQIGPSGLKDVAKDPGMLLREPNAPDTSPAPTMEDIAAREPDKERRRRQRMAALMAQGRFGTILTGPGGLTPNNSVGGGGKQMVGA